MTIKPLRVLGFTMGIVWIVFGIYILFRGEVEGSSRMLGALSIIGVGVYFINYAITGKSTIRKQTNREKK
ncbi:MAG: hypothetical protein COA75_09295 [Cellvibrionales bacterium]|nr:MAG: hypothetical protein COA75_09295 [Cellvibrionales bacterium]